MDCGTQFVEILKRIGYSKANSLNGQDFDWLFETVEDKAFLDCFCTNLNEEHILSEKELHSLSSLLKSGKPLLEEDTLNEVLKTCEPFELEPKSCEENDEEKCKMLEDELQTLQKLKDLKVRRCNKLQMMASTNQLMSLKLKEKGEERSKNLKEIPEKFVAMNTKLNNELQFFTERAVKLTTFFATGPRHQELDRHPVLLFQVALNKYLGQEEQSTAALTLYTKKQFFQGISELVESSKEENFQLVDIRNSSTCNKSSEMCKEKLELNRLQMAYISAQHQLIQQKAKNLSMRMGLQWVEENIYLLKKTPRKEKIEVRISSLNDDITKLKKHLAQINSETLPLLVKEDAELLNMPVVRGDFDLQLARQDYYIARQKQVCDQLIKQKASFELLQLAYEIELRKLKDINRLLENMVQDLEKSNNNLVQVLETMSDLSVLHDKVPRSTIHSTHSSTHRLCQLLEGNTPKQLFRTYEDLEKLAEKLQLDIRSMLDQLTVSNREQMLCLTKMDTDLTALRSSMYCGGENVCLSNQELTGQFTQLEYLSNKLNQLIMDFLADIKAKKKVLECNKLQQVERKLYVYFFKDEDRLKTTVERAEEQAKAETSS